MEILTKICNGQGTPKPVLQRGVRIHV